MNFLEGIFDSQPRPLLAQMESGKIEGYSRREARALREHIGIA